MDDSDGEDAIGRGGCGVEPGEKSFGALVSGEECSCCTWVSVVFPSFHGNYS